MDTSTEKTNRVRIADTGVTFLTDDEFAELKKTHELIENTEGQFVWTEMEYPPVRRSNFGTPEIEAEAKFDHELLQAQMQIGSQQMIRDTYEVVDEPKNSLKEFGKDVPIEEQQAVLDHILNSDRPWTADQYEAERERGTEELRRTAAEMDDYLVALEDDEERKAMDDHADLQELNRIADENLEATIKAEEVDYFRQIAGLASLGDAIPVNKVQNPPKPKPPTAQLRSVSIVKDGTGNTGRLEPEITVKKIEDAKKRTQEQFERMRDETMEQFSARLDWEQSLKFKCANEDCTHEKRAHIRGDANIGPCNAKNCDCSKFQKKVFERPEHLTARPFTENLALRDLQKQLHAEARANIKPEAKNSRRLNRKFNPKSRRQR